MKFIEILEKVHSNPRSEVLRRAMRVARANPETDQVKIAGLRGGIRAARMASGEAKYLYRSDRASQSPSAKDEASANIRGEFSIIPKFAKAFKGNRFRTGSIAKSLGKSRLSPEKRVEKSNRLAAERRSRRLGY
jgi:hypothetical protein